MIIKGIIDCDLINYKKPAMVIEFPNCTFKCDKECGRQVCQNGALAGAPPIPILVSEIVDRYLQNDMSQAIVCQGLEPFDSWTDLRNLIRALRQYTEDDIVIYTGYNVEELEEELMYIWDVGYKNIIIKYGRYIPGQKPHYDEILGVNLASDNQYAEKIS